MTDIFRRPYDIYLDDKGYFLLKDEDGRLQRGSSQWRMTDPFTRKLSEEGRRSKQVFRFNGGTGCRNYDGSDRYYYGENVDTRSGTLQIGPKWSEYPQIPTAVGEYIREAWPYMKVIEPGDRLAVQVDLSATTDTRIVCVPIGSDLSTGPDWSNIDVEVWDDSSNTPNAIISGGGMTVMDGVPPGNWRPWKEYGKLGAANWYECMLSASTDIYDGYWIVVYNNSSDDIFWPFSKEDQSYLRYAYKDGATAWNVTTPTGPPYRFPAVKVRDDDGIDGIVRKIVRFPSAYGEYLLVAAGNKIFYYDYDTNTFAPIPTPGSISPHGNDGFADIVVDIYPYFFGKKQKKWSSLDPRLLIGFGSEDVLAWTGELSSSSGWYEVSGEVAHVFGYARNLIWKAEGSVLTGTPYLSETPDQWDSDNHGYVIGDTDTPIIAIQQGPEGEVLVLKPEGIFNIYLSTSPAYPETDSYLYDTTLIDMTSERVGRGFMGWWVDALYWPLEYGLAEFRFRQGDYRDTWIRREDEGGNLVTADAFDPYFGRFTAMSPAQRTFWLAKASQAPDGAWDWSSGSPTYPERTRGLELWSWDGRGFHQVVADRWSYFEDCQTIFQESRGRGKARVWYGYGARLRALDIPSWTQDRAQGDPAQELDSYNNFRTGDIPQPSDWYAGGDPPHVITPVFYGDGLDEDKSWIGVEVHFEQVSINYPVLFTVYVRCEEGQDWLELANVTPGAVLPGSPTQDDYDAYYAAWTGGSHQFTWDSSISGTPTVLPPVSRWCQIAIAFDVLTHDANTTGNAVNNLKVSSVDLIYDANPETIAQHEMLIACVDYQDLHEGGKTVRTARTIKEDLQALLESKRAVTLTDTWGNSTEVRVVGVTDEPYDMTATAPNLGEGFVIESVAGVSLLEVTWPP